MRKDGVIRTFTTQLERVTDLEGNTLMFNLMSSGAGGYRTASARMDRDQVPEFAGNVVWAEVQKIAAKPWAFHRFVRFVDPPAADRAAAQPKSTPPQASSPAPPSKPRQRGGLAGKPTSRTVAHCIRKRLEVRGICDCIKGVGPQPIASVLRRATGLLRTIQSCRSSVGKATG